MLAATPIGAHVRVSGGLAKGGLAYANQVAAQAVQVFVANPRSWAMPDGDPEQDRAFHLAVDTGLPAFVHASYLVNLGSPTDLTLQRSVLSLSHALVRGRAIGAHGVVVHTGSAVAEGSFARAMLQVRDHLLPLLDALPGDAPDLLLEPTAGQGRSLCATVDDLAPYLDALDRHPRVGVCLDTCHAFASGHNLAAPGGMAATLDRLVEVAGEGRLKLVHANDSMDALGACKDRHESIGRGHIGSAAFAEMLAHPALAGVPVVVETPGEAADHARDVLLLRELAGQLSGPSPGSSW